MKTTCYESQKMCRTVVLLCAVVKINIWKEKRLGLESIQLCDSERIFVENLEKDKLFIPFYPDYPFLSQISPSILNIPFYPEYPLLSRLSPSILNIPFYLDYPLLTQLFHSILTIPFYPDYPNYPILF